jgi:predicted permease
MEKDEKKRGMMRFCMHFPNNGFLGISLAMAVFPDKPLVITSLVAINVVTTTISCTTGAYLISADKSKISFKKALINPVIFSFILGVALNLLKITDYVPEVATFSDGVKGIVTPLSMMILGIKLANVPVKSLFNSASVYYVSFVKLIVMPIIAVIAGVLLIKALSLDVNTVYAFFIAFAVRTASLATTFADQFNGDTNASVAFTLGSTILSILTIPVLYYLLNLLMPFIF